MRHFLNKIIVIPIFLFSKMKHSNDAFDANKGKLVSIKLISNKLISNMGAIVWLNAVFAKTFVAYVCV